ncbi:MAG TPA: TadE/TadG family type IV pilus assembly protein, partial [Nitrospirota bacterium]|nr:TadE/TadG family type IV pilus assembly protein [Nitrospirota bacterium]
PPIIPKCRKGQTLVEFALAIPILFLLIFGIAELGRAWFYSNHLVNSVRAAARYGAVLGYGPSTDTMVNTYLRNEIANHVPATNIASTRVKIVSGADGTVRQAGSAATQGDTIEVSVTYNFRILTGSLIKPLYDIRPIRLTRTATMLYE